MAAFSLGTLVHIYRTVNGTGKYNEILIAFQLLLTLEKDISPSPYKAVLDASDLYLHSFPCAFHLLETPKYGDIHLSHDLAKQTMSEIS